MKASIPKPFGYERDGPLSGKFESQGQKLEFEPGNMTETWQFLLVIAMFGHGAIETEPDWRFTGGQIAHDAKAADSTARISRAGR